MAVLDVEEEAAHLNAATGLELRRKGRPIPAGGLSIAALGHQHGLPAIRRGRDSHVMDEIRHVVRRLTPTRVEG